MSGNGNGKEATISNVTLKQRIDYERRFAASAAVSPGYAREEVGWLDPDRFASPTIAAFWHGIRSGEDIVTASTRAGRDFYSELSSWIATDATPENIHALAGEISRWAYLHNVGEGLSQIAMQVSRGDEMRVREMLGNLADEQASGVASSVDASEGLTAFSETLDHLDNRSISTHVARVDMATGGLERQTLTVLASRPGMGKTALAWQIARNVAQYHGRALYVSLEMSQTALYARAACGVTGIRWRDVRAGRCSAEDIARLRLAAESLRALYTGKLFVNDRPQTVSGIWREVSILRPDIIVIDHLRWLRDPGEKEVVRLGNMTAQLKEIGKEFNAAMLVLHQLNRGLMARDEKRPTLADLRESGQVEENADAVWFLHRPDYFAVDAPPPVSATELILAKFRDDVPNQAVRMDYHLGAQWFTTPGQNP